MLNAGLVAGVQPSAGARHPQAPTVRSGPAAGVAFLQGRMSRPVHSAQSDPTMHMSDIDGDDPLVTLKPAAPAARAPALPRPRLSVAVPPRSRPPAAAPPRSSPPVNPPLRSRSAARPAAFVAPVLLVALGSAESAGSASLSRAPVLDASALPADRQPKRSRSGVNAKNPGPFVADAVSVAADGGSLPPHRHKLGVVCPRCSLTSSRIVSGDAAPPDAASAAVALPLAAIAGEGNLRSVITPSVSAGKRVRASAHGDAAGSEAAAAPTLRKNLEAATLADLPSESSAHAAPTPRNDLRPAASERSSRRGKAGGLDGVAAELLFCLG